MLFSTKNDKHSSVRNDRFYDDLSKLEDNLFSIRYANTDQFVVCCDEFKHATPIYAELDMEISKRNSQCYNVKHNKSDIRWK